MVNVIRDVIETSGLAGRYEVIKAHDPAAPAYVAIKERCRKFVYVARDVRDVIVSDMTLYGLPITFPRVATMALLPALLKSYRYWMSREELYKTSYDALVSDLPRHVREIALFLGAEITDEQATAIADRHRKEKVSQEVASHFRKKPTGEKWEFDNAIGFREGHFQGGETGKWTKFLSPWQVAFIEFHAQPWLLENGFAISQSQLRRAVAGVIGAPFLVIGQIVYHIKLSLGRREIF